VCESSLGESFIVLPDEAVDSRDSPSESPASKESSDAFWRSVLAWTAQLGGVRGPGEGMDLRAEKREPLEPPHPPQWNEASVFGGGGGEEEGLLRLLQTVRTLSESTLTYPPLP